MTAGVVAGVGPIAGTLTGLPEGAWHAAVTLAAIVGLGLLDDVRPLGARTRLQIQFAVALWFVTAAVAASPASRSLWVNVALASVAVLWLVGLTNAYNFMDGIDGIAAGQAIVAAAGWTVLAVVSSEQWLLWPAAVVGGTAGGFLVHNWHPARLFMGDAGSTGLGYAFGAITVLAWSRDPLLALAGVLLVWPFVFDAAFTWLRRLHDGEDVLRPHRSHMYQRLIAAGWSQRRVAFLYFLAAICGSGLAVAGYVERSIATAYGAVAALASVLWITVGWAERRARAALPRADRV
jgi:UDP-N-acetylmuramyl pentapeptide phosphotransferase/UDP-N-acetylglucosamine-1-phosphate transferase